MKGFIRAAYYARVSTQKQAEETTIQSQRQELIARIEHDQLRLDPAFEFCDDGYSGSELLRPALEDLRDKVAGSLIDRLYVHSPDRLARRFAHQVLLLEEFSKHDCEVVFLNHQGLPDSPEANLLLQMQGMIAEYEREKILERTRRGRRYSAAAGNVSVFGGAPYGYRYISKSQGAGTARWEIDLQESEVVRLMFDCVACREMSLAAVCRELKRRGVVTRHGGADWHTATVRGILINPAYCGQAKFGRTRLQPRKPGKRAKRGDPAVPRQSKVPVATDPQEQVTITVPAIVSTAVFEQVGKQMEENRRRQREHHDGAKYLLSGLTICGACGSAYCSQRVSGSLFYYRCIGADKHRRRGNALCENRSVNGRRFEELVWTQLCQLLRDPQRLKSELARRRQETSPTPSQLAQAQRRLKDLDGRIDRLIDAYTTGLVTKDEFESRIGLLRDQHDREAAACVSLSGADDGDHAAWATQNLQHFAEEVATRLDAADYDLKRRLFKLLIKRIEIHPDEIRIVYKVPDRPFELGPENRGKLQHWLWRHQWPTAIKSAS